MKLYSDGSTVDRIAQTLIILCLIMCLWALLKVYSPKEQFHYINFGGLAQLVSVTPYHYQVKPGDQIKFGVKWRLLAPLPQDRLIAYYLGNPNGIPLAGIDTTAPLNGGPSYTQVAEGGRLITDVIEMNIPIDTAPGVYEISTFIFPVGSFELNSAFSSVLSPWHRTLFIVTVEK